MRLFGTKVLVTFAAVVGGSLSGCSSGVTSRENVATTINRAEPLILAEGEGERRVRRPRPDAPSALTGLLIIKIDPRNGGSREFFMGYEDIAPGRAIPPHFHPHADEILFVHRGNGIASLGSREAPVTAGTTIYIPRNTRVALRNTGSEPLSIAFIFSKPGFEELMRATSVPEGSPAPPLSPGELANIRARYPHYVVYENP
jgi:quercetin dioxygenase-like cupin family protein